MNSKFVIAVREATRNLPPTTEVIDRIMNFRVELVKEIEDAILRNESTGKAFLLSNISELLTEKSLVEPIVRHQLGELHKRNLDEYNSEYSNTKELALSLEDTLHELEKLRKVYFEKPDQTQNPGNKLIIQNAEKIYNIDKIDNAEFK